MTRAECAARGVDPASGVELGDRVLAAHAVEVLTAALLDTLAVFHRDNPLARGAPRRDLRRGRLAHLADKPFDALLERITAQGRAELDGPLVRAAGFAVVLDADQQRLRDRVLVALAEAGLEGCTDRQLAELGPDAVPIVYLLGADGTVTDVAGIGWVLTPRLVQVKEQVTAWLAGHDALTPQDFKELSGLSRKSAIPLLEWLDRQRITRRDGDRRVAF